jgi:hypothetical protein
MSMLRAAPTSLQFVNSETSCFRPLTQATLTKPWPWFTILLPCFFLFRLGGALQIPSGAAKGFKLWDGVK